MLRPDPARGAKNAPAAGFWGEERKGEMREKGMEGKGE